MFKSLQLKVSLPFVLLTISLMVGGTTLVERNAVDRATTPMPENVSCVKCHTDKATLRAIEDKSGDSLYLVHIGDLTREQLKQLEADVPKRPKK